MPDENMNFSGTRIAREKQTIEAMLEIYCKEHHQSQGRLCNECLQLLDYAQRRLDNCPFQEAKPACNHCHVHCYSTSMRDRVKSVMLYAGPRMTLRHPILSFYHLFDRLRKAPKLSRKKR